METKKISVFLSALMVLLSLAAPLWASPSRENPPAPGGANASVTITDIVGRTVTLPGPTSRLVGTHNPTMNIAIILGGGGRYIAGFGNKNMAGGLYGLVFPELGPLTQIGMGREVNFESCLAVGADLAILPERFASQAAQFEAVGIPAAVILPNSESFETIKNSIALLGTLVGQAERAANINAFFDNKINTAKSIAQRAGSGPKALFLGASSRLTVANGLMLQSLMLETAGAVNVARNIGGQADFVQVSLEEIIGWNPDVIYMPVYAQYKAEDIYGDAAWSSINAVKNRKVLTLPSIMEPWDYPTPSASMGLTWLLNSLYPELYSLDQVYADAKEYYELVYGRSFSAEQLGLK